MSSAWIPIVASFAVYLVPLVGPHAFWLLGETLVQELSSRVARDPRWIAADFGLGIAAQVVVGVLIAWSMRSRARLLIWLVVTPALIGGLNTAMLVTIPSYFLIEADTAPELTTWPERCVARDLSLVDVRGPATQTEVGATRWWVQAADGRYAILDADCGVEDAALPRPAVVGNIADFAIAPAFATSAGDAVLERSVPRTSQSTWWLWTNPATALISIAKPELAEGAPILSDTADAVGWIQQVAGSGPPVLERVLVRPTHIMTSPPASPTTASPDVSIELTPFGAASYVLVGVDTGTREVVLWRNDQPLTIGFDGAPRSSPQLPPHIEPQSTTYLRHRDGWIAWDAYREDDVYQIAWSLPAGAGTHPITRGRSITAAAVDPSGTFIAVSETTTLNIGHALDVVYVIRAHDGVDVFRHYLPRYARSALVFFNGGRFAYSDLVGTHVLKVPTGQ